MKNKNDFETSLKELCDKLQCKLETTIKNEIRKKL